MATFPTQNQGSYVPLLFSPQAENTQAVSGLFLGSGSELLGNRHLGQVEGCGRGNQQNRVKDRLRTGGPNLAFFGPLSATGSFQANAPFFSIHLPFVFSQSSSCPAGHLPLHTQSCSLYFP